MQIFETGKTLPENFRQGVVAIGNFDGVHKGHHALLSDAKARAEKAGVPFGILTFEPHPRTLFQEPSEPFRLTPTPLKRKKLSELAPDYIYECPFDRALAQLSAEEFITQILRQKLGVSEIVVGEDFHFGQNRGGDISTLKESGIPTHALGDVTSTKSGQKYSASTIRSYLRRGMIAEANAMLGWDWEIDGVVIHGNKRGRELGYPTANIALNHVLHPAFGIYATWARIEGEDTWRKAATNIGIRPMFKSEQALMEVHLLDYEGDLYDKTLEVRPVALLRGEAKFESLEALIEQMDKDCQKTRDILGA